MKTYLVSVSQEVCADFEIEAATPQSAVKKALSLERGIMYSDDWCEGHRDTRTAHVLEELPAE
jgi:hypothetical protein